MVVSNYWQTLYTQGEEKERGRERGARGDESFDYFTRRY